MIELFVAVVFLLLLFLSYRCWSEITTLRQQLNDKQNQIQTTIEVVKELTRLNNNQQIQITTWKDSYSDARKTLERTRQAMDQELAAWKTTATKDIREDALKRSRSVMRGQATEHLAPYMIPGLNPKDFRFMGDPLDYFVACGSSAIKDGTSNEITELILLDIKTGKSGLNKTQRRIRDAVVAGRVIFMTYNPDTDITKKWKHVEKTNVDT